MKKTILLTFIPFILFPTLLLSNQNQHIINIDQKVKNAYEKKYGMRSNLRLKYFIKLVDNIKDKTALQKLYETNKIVNKLLHYASDKRLWQRDNYLALPLVSIGMGYGDTEDIAMVKKLVLIKLGLDPNKLKLLQKVDIPFIDVKDNRSYENIVLGYFKENSDDPIILDHKLTKGDRLYRLKKRYNFKVIEAIPNSNYHEIIKNNYSIDTVDRLFNRLD